MDNDPRNHLEVPTPMIKLQSSDGDIFEVEVKVAQLSLHIKEMMDDLGVEENEIISIPQNGPNISGAILGKIIQWANHHKDDPATAGDDERKVKPTDNISSWDAEFPQVDQTTLFQIIRAADYLNIKGLLDITCKTVAKMIKRMTRGDVCERFNIQNDFSPDEDWQGIEELKWCDRPEEDRDPTANCDIMHKISAPSVQNVDLENDQVVQDCFRNSNVVRKVLEHFSNSKLLYEFQFVNQLWNYEARSVLKVRGNISARLTCGYDFPYQEDVEPFGVHLREMNIVPYSGISIEFRPTDHTGRSAAVDPTHEAILDRLPLKRISVKIFGDWWSCRDCPTLLLLKKLLQDFSEVIEELKLDIWQQREEFIQYFLRDCSFPSLKVIKLREENNTRGEAYTSYIEGLVARAPRLQELHTTGPINLLRNLVEGTEAVLVHEHEICAPFGFDWISPSLVDSLRLRRLHLKYPHSEFNFERFNGIAPMLLQASCTTLCSIDLNAVFAIPLMSYGISFENVKDLRLDLNFGALERIEPRILRIVKNFNFSRIFPNLGTVKIVSENNLRDFSPEHMNAFIDQANAVLGEPLLDRAANVKELNLLHWHASDETASFFAKILPTIEILKVGGTAQQEIHFGIICKHWRALRELDAYSRILPSTGNLDSAFCGIFPEEVAELRQKDEAYLKRVNIVPVMPAITCLKNLKALVLNYDGRCDEPFVYDGTFMFSKVTALIAFQRCPTLAVSLNIRSFAVPPDMTYLRPYVSVNSLRLGEDL